jgi:hypothetical protein
MANRFLVGSGARFWSSTSSWSATSGGPSGASVPTSADAVIIDNSSGAGIINIDAGIVVVECLSFNTANALGTTNITLDFNGQSLNVYGSIAFSSGMTIASSGAIGFLSLVPTTAGSYTFNFAAKDCSAISLIVQPTSSTLTTYTNAVTTAITFYTIYIDRCTFGTNNAAITTTGDFYIYGTDGTNNITTTASFGSSVCAVGGNFLVSAGASAVSISFATSVITATGSFVFGSTGYTGTAANAITVITSAGAALRTNGSFTIDERGSTAKSSYSLPEIGSTPATVTYLYIYTQFAATTVQLRATRVINDIYIEGLSTVSLAEQISANRFLRYGGNLTLTSSTTYTLKESWFMQGGYSLVPSTSTVSILGIVEGTSVPIDVTFDSQGYTYGSVALSGQTQTITNTYNTAGLTCATGFTSTTGAWGQTFTTTIASPAVITLTNPSLVSEGARITLTTTGALPTGLSANVTYYVLNLSGSTCNLSATPAAIGGTAITTTGTQSGAHTATTVAPYSQLILNYPLTTGTLTLTGDVINRHFVRSNIAGTAITVAASGAKSLTNVDFSDITASGTAWTGTSLGNCQGNTNITFTAATTRYAKGSGDWANTAVWSSSSGGATGASAPLPQDTVILNAASTAVGIFINNRRALGKDITTTGFTGTIYFNFTQPAGYVFDPDKYGTFVYGSLVIPATTGLVSLSYGAPIILAGRATSGQNINISLQLLLPNSPMGICVYAPNGVYSLTGDLTLYSDYNCNSLNVSCGTLNTAGYTLNFLGTGDNFTFNSKESWNAGQQAISPFIPATNGVAAAIVNFGASTVNVNAFLYVAGFSVASCSSFNAGTSTVNYNGSPGYVTGQITGTATKRFYNLSIVTQSNPPLSNVYVDNTFTLPPFATSFSSGQLYFYNIVNPNIVTFTSMTIGNLNPIGITTTLIYYTNTTSTTGIITATNNYNLGGNTGITFIGNILYAVFSGYSGAFVLPSGLKGVASIEVYGGGGQAGSRATNNSGGGGGGGYSLGVSPSVLSLTSGQTIYINAANATGKKTVTGAGANGGSSWVNYTTNAQPTSSSEGILATGGRGSSTANGGTGGTGSFGDTNTTGATGGNAYALTSTLGGAGGASFARGGGNSAGNQYVLGGTGGGGTNAAGVNTSGSVSNPNGTAGGRGTSVGTGGTAGVGGITPTAGGDGTTGGGGGGGGVSTRTAQTISTLTRTAGTITATVTTSLAHGLTSGDSTYITVTLLTGTYSRTGTTVTCTVTGHGLSSTNTPYITINTGAVLSGTYTVTVLNANSFTFTTAASGSTSGTLTMGQAITATAYTVTVTGLTTFTFDTAASTNIYKISSGTELPIPNVAAGGNGSNSSLIPYVYYNGAATTGTIGLGGGGGGGGGMPTYSTGITAFGVDGGAGGDGGIAAGGGGGGSSTFGFSANGGSGGPGLVIISLVYQGGTSAAFMIG